MLRTIVVSWLLAIAFPFSAVAGNEKIDSRLQTLLSSVGADEKVAVIIYLQPQVDLKALESSMRNQFGDRLTPEVRYRTVLMALQDLASISQGDLLQLLQAEERNGRVSEVRPFWIRNLITAHVTAPVVDILASHPDVEMIYEDGLLVLDKPVESSDALELLNSCEPGLKVINAHKVWEMGYTGQGRLVMNIDTGPNLHRAFSARWRGYQQGVQPGWAWFDPIYGTTSPRDYDGSANHGTHTMGIMCGLDTMSHDTIGVAFGARWIAAATIITSPHTSYSIAAFQWAANPDSNINTMHDVPDVISCSWYDPDVSGSQCTQNAGGYGPVIEAVEALGTAVVFSAGNAGPGPSTITAPKNRIRTATDIFCVGAVHGNTSGYPIASFSSRGPSVCSGPDSLRIKPEVSAPGVNVRSARGTTNYANLSGTSMAAPHVAGAIALLRSVNPNKTGTELKYLLMQTAVDKGTPGEDNDYKYHLS